MKAHEIWIRGWLRRKEFCRNPYHEMFNPLIDKLNRDLNKGLNRNLLFVGDPRSGKTYASIWTMCFFNWCYFGREEYEPSANNTKPLKDIFWKVDDFNKATRKSENRNKFLVMEEQGVEQYAKDFYNQDIQSYDKITQIFGIDNTNVIINLPYIFDLYKGTRLKGNYLYRIFRKSKNRIDLLICEKHMNITTDKAWYKPTMTRWENFPDIRKIYPELISKYEEIKQKYNADKKDELTGLNKQEQFFGKI